MRKILGILLLSITPAWAGFPPTTTRGNSDAAPVTTFNIYAPNIPISHVGITATIGTIPIAGGGTNNGSLSVAAGGILATDGSMVINTGAGSSGQVLTSQGTNTSIWTTLATGSNAGTVTSVAFAAPSIFTVSGSPVTTNGTLTLSYSGTPLPVANGGTGSSVLVDHGVLIGASNALSATTAGASGQILISQGSAADPTWLSILPFASGGTGFSSYTDGQLLIGNTATGGLSQGTLTGGSGITIANGNGSITIATVGGTGTLSPLTTKGDLWGFSTINARVPVGVSGAILQAQPGAALGVGYTNAAYPLNPGTTGTILTSNGSNFVNTVATYPNSTAINQILYSSANNVVATLASASGAVLITNATNVPSFLQGSNSSPLIRFNGTSFVNGLVVLTTDVSGILPLANGGTNAALTAVAGGIAYSGSSALALTAVGGSGQVLTSQNNNTPIWTTPSAGSVTSVALTPPAFLSVSGSPITTNGTFTLSYNGVPLPISSGGTNNNALSVASGGVLITDGTMVINVGVGSSGQVLTSQGTSTAIWTTVASASGTMTIQGNRQTGTSMSAGTAITPTANTTTETFVVGNGGAVIITATPPVTTSGMSIGQALIVCGTSNTNTVQYNNTVNLVLNGSAILGKDQCLTLRYNGTDGTNLSWIESNRNF